MTNPIKVHDIPPRKVASVYPEEFAKRMEGRTKRAIGDFFGLTKYGVNFTELAPGGSSALLHIHSKQEEFIFIISGHPTLILDDKEVDLEPYMCVGFKPNQEAHKLINKSDKPVVYIEIGDRIPGDEVTYPADDLKAVLDENKKWVITKKDGTPY